jgi:cytoskeletal protein CcmA (bactofilin family)
MRIGSVSLLRWKALDLAALPFQQMLGDSYGATSRLLSSTQAGTALRTFREWFDPGHLWAQLLGDHQMKRRIKMFGKNEVDQDDDADEMPVAPQLKLSEVLQAAESLRSDKSEISRIDPEIAGSLRANESEVPGIGAGMAELLRAEAPAIFAIGPGMTVIGNVSSEGTLRIFGRVRGELNASVVQICDGAEVEGIISAQNLFIGGRFKGNIKAHHVTLTSSANVEGEIYHRSLVVEKNARFAGISRPQEEAVREVTDARPTLQLVPTDESPETASLGEAGN